MVRSINQEAADMRVCSISEAGWARRGRRGGGRGGYVWVMGNLRGVVAKSETELNDLG